jgi:copper chaperone CopZ
MRKLLFKVEDRVCDECALALRRFIGHMEGIESVGVEDRRIAVVFDNAKMAEEDLIKLTKDSLEKLGHKLTEHWHFV